MKKPIELEGFNYPDIGEHGAQLALISAAYSLKRIADALEGIHADVTHATGKSIFEQVFGK